MEEPKVLFTARWVRENLSPCAEAYRSATQKLRRRFGAGVDTPITLLHVAEVLCLDDDFNWLLRALEDVDETYPVRVRRIVREVRAAWETMEAEERCDWPLMYAWSGLGRRIEAAKDRAAPPAYDEDCEDEMARIRAVIRLLDPAEFDYVESMRRDKAADRKSVV